jgi:outer membrane immunogenic protein
MFRFSHVLAASVAFAVATPALAADLPRAEPARAPVFAPTPVYNWSGLYIGAHVGGSWADQSSTIAAIAPPLLTLGSVIRDEPSGFLGGAQAGINFQFSNIVLGVEADWSWSNADDTTDTTTLLAGTVVRGSAEIKWFATATGRLGFAANNVLLYVKGGGAWMDVDYTASALVGGVLVATSTINDTRTGWTVGGGIEYGFSPNWSAKIEYNYLDFGSERYAFAAGAGAGAITASADIDTRVHLVKGGINYRFNWGGPVVARY